MSKIDFNVPDLNERNPSPVRLDTNVLAGFKRAMRLGQQRLAMDYLNEVLDVLIAAVENDTPAVVAEEKPKKAPAKVVEAEA